MLRNFKVKVLVSPVVQEHTASQANHLLIVAISRYNRCFRKSPRNRTDSGLQFPQLSDDRTRFNHQSGNLIIIIVKMNSYLPEDVLEYVFSLRESNQDRNTLSLVCKFWYEVERLSRYKVIIRNCHALSPRRLVTRFAKVKDLTLKGKPNVGDSSLVPKDWGGFAYPWIEALAENCLGIEQLKLKRMIVSNKALKLISHSFPNFKSLVLVHCRGFSTDGLADIAANCRFLEVLDLRENVVKEGSHDWISCFPESCTSLISLNIMELKEVDSETLERLVSRSPNLKSLRLRRSVPIDTLQKILVQVPQLEDLGIGSHFTQLDTETYTKFCDTVLNCKSICNLSGTWIFLPECVPAIFPICSKLIFLNLSHAVDIQGSAFKMLVSRCQILQRLWVLDSIVVNGLEEVASTCKDLLELRVFRSHRGSLTEKGLLDISVGCPKLQHLQYVCNRMTNAALMSVATNCPNLLCFNLHVQARILDITSQPFDEGVGAIVQSCKKLRRLSLSGIITDQVFLYIGIYAAQLEVLTVEFSGSSHTGLLYVMNGCEKLRKLVIRNSPFGDAALLAAFEKYKSMQFVWVSSCDVTLGGCKALARKVPMLNVEIINEDIKEKSDNVKVEKMYLYRSLDGPRNNAPDYVWTL